MRGDELPVWPVQLLFLLRVHPALTAIILPLPVKYWGRGDNYAFMFHYLVQERLTQIPLFPVSRHNFWGHRKERPTSDRVDSLNGGVSGEVMCVQFQVNLDECWQFDKSEYIKFVPYTNFQNESCTLLFMRAQVFTSALRWLISTLWLIANNLSLPALNRTWDESSPSTSSLGVDSNVLGRCSSPSPCLNHQSPEPQTDPGSYNHTPQLQQEDLSHQVWFRSLASN